MIVGKWCALGYMGESVAGLIVDGLNELNFLVRVYPKNSPVYQKIFPITELISHCVIFDSEDEMRTYITFWKAEYNTLNKKG